MTADHDGSENICAANTTAPHRHQPPQVTAFGRISRRAAARMYGTVAATATRPDAIPLAARQSMWHGLRSASADRDAPLRARDPVVVDARVAASHQAAPLVELPVLVAVAAPPLAGGSRHSYSKRTEMWLPANAHSSLRRR